MCCRSQPKALLGLDSRTHLMYPLQGHNVFLLSAQTDAVQHNNLAPGNPWFPIKQDPAAPAVQFAMQGLLRAQCTRPMQWRSETMSMALLQAGQLLEHRDFGPLVSAGLSEGEVLLKRPLLWDSSSDSPGMQT
jgi:hypothetical protein